MSAASCLLSEEDLQCSICLDVLTDPVSTPCGHNFCDRCITENWRINVSYKCPFCNQMFPRQPELKTNIFISAMVAQFRQRAQPNVTQDRCLEHDKPLELFCESDHSCVCVICSLQHQGHALVPLKEVHKYQAHALRVILDRTQKIKEVQKSLGLSERAAEEEATEGDHFFSALMEMAQKARYEVLQEIKEKQTKVKKEAEALIQSLKQEICDLKQGSSEVEQLSLSEDHVLKTFPSLTAAPHRDWTRVTAPPILDTVQRAVTKVKKQVLSMDPKPLLESRLMKLQRHAVEVTLDSGTAHPELTVSADLKQVSHIGVRRRLSIDPWRITGYWGVLGTQSFSSGRHYFEVQVSQNTNWVLGIVKVSINRKAAIPSSPSNGFWTIHLRRGFYGAIDPEPYRLLVKSAVQKVGVFLDYEEALVRFYDVDTETLLYCFTGCSFTDTLCPFFHIGAGEKENFAPLIITPVQI